MILYATCYKRQPVLSDCFCCAGEIFSYSYYMTLRIQLSGMCVILIRELRHWCRCRGCRGLRFDSESGPTRLQRTFEIFYAHPRNLIFCTLIYVETLCSDFVEAVNLLAHVE